MNNLLAPVVVIAVIAAFPTFMFYVMNRRGRKERDAERERLRQEEERISAAARARREHKAKWEGC